MTEVAKISPQESLLPADPMINMIERVALDPNSDLDKLERMLAMKDRIDAKEAEKAFNAAFSSMQAALPVIPENGAIKNSRGEVQSTFPLWEDVIAALREPLSDNGLDMSFDRRREGDLVYFGCIVRHSMGHSRRAEIDLPRDDSGSKNAVQGCGSTVSYGQRYSSKMLINWVSEGTEDDDGKQAGARGTVSAEQFIALRDRAAEAGVSEETICKAAGVSDLQFYPAKDFQSAMNRLAKNIAAKGGA